MYSSFMVLGACVQKWTVVAWLFYYTKVWKWLFEGITLRWEWPARNCGKECSLPMPTPLPHPTPSDRTQETTWPSSPRDTVVSHTCDLTSRRCYLRIFIHLHSNIGGKIHYQWGWKLGSHLCSVQTPQWRRQPEVLQSLRNVWGKEMNPT